MKMISQLILIVYPVNKIIIFEYFIFKNRSSFIYISKIKFVLSNFYEQMLQMIKNINKVIRNLKRSIPEGLA